MRPLLLVLSGPTASGKTAAAVAIARHFGTAVVSSDSRQFYRELHIGSAAPSTDEQQGVPHFFIGSHSITEELDAGSYETQALEQLHILFEKHPVVVLCGGSGLYADAVCYGFDPLPRADAVLREELNQLLETGGIEALQQRLKILDPEYYNQVDLRNPRRLLRAIEVCLVTGKPFSQQRTGKAQERSFHIQKIALDIDRDLLYDRINERVLKMMEQGLEAEARAVLPYRNRAALQTVGYKELFAYFDGETNLETAVALIQQHTRNFARRQMTWLRRDTALQWLPWNDEASLIRATEEALRA